MRIPTLVLLLFLLATGLLLGACAPSDTGGDAASPSAVDIEGRWTGTIHVVRSDGSRAALEVGYVIGELIDGAFGYEHTIAIGSGEVLERSGQGTLGSDGSLLMNQDGQMIVTMGRLLEPDRIELQSVELVEIGSGTVPDEVTFAGLVTLEREAVEP